MKRALFAFTIGILHYSVFHMIVSVMFEGKIIYYSHQVSLCVMWLCIFTSLMGLIGDLINDKFFISRIDKTIKKIIIEHYDIFKKYDRPDLFADALQQLVKEEAGKMKKKKK